MLRDVTIHCKVHEVLINPRKNVLWYPNRHESKLSVQQVVLKSTNLNSLRVILIFLADTFRHHGLLYCNLGNTVRKYCEPFIYKSSSEFITWLKHAFMNIYTHDLLFKFLKFAFIFATRCMCDTPYFYYHNTQKFLGSYGKFFNYLTHPKLS